MLNSTARIRGNKPGNGELAADSVWIATERLADWVILSACNTAGAQGENAEALSGMARAFFYAGARALLVSHWEVGSFPVIDPESAYHPFQYEVAILAAELASWVALA